jgi:hypothetical protein
MTDEERLALSKPVGMPWRPISTLSTRSEDALERQDSSRNGRRGPSIEAIQSLARICPPAQSSADGRG